MSEILNTSGEFYFAIFGEYSIATYKRNRRTWISLWPFI